MPNIPPLTSRPDEAAASAHASADASASRPSPPHPTRTLSSHTAEPASITRRPILVTALVCMVVTGLLVTGVLFYFLYHTKIEESRTQLAAMVAVQVSLIEAMSQVEPADHDRSTPDQPHARSLSDLVHAYNNKRDFAETGEFVLGQLNERQEITFLQQQRHQRTIAPIPLNSGNATAEPMRRALTGHTGTVISIDYRGADVIAAYQPITPLRAGLVAKIDLEEIQRPFLQAMGVMLGVVLVVISIGAIMMITITSPMIRRAEKREGDIRNYAAKLENQTHYSRTLMQLLQAIVKISHEAKTVDEVYRLAARETCEVIAWDIGHIYLATPEAPRRLKPTSIWYTKPGLNLTSFQQATMETSFPVGTGIPGRVLETGKATWVEDLAGDPNFPRAAAARAAGIGCGAGIPIVADGDTVAVLECFSSQATAYDEKLTGILNYIGILIGRIVERKQVENEIRQLQTQYQLILNSVGEGIYRLDLDGNATFVNHAATRVLQYDAHELLGRPLYRLIHHLSTDGEGAAPNHCVFCAGHTDGRPHSGTADVLWRKDGTCFPVEYTCTPLRNEQGNIEGTVVTFKDITERKRAEREQESLHTQLIEISRRAGMAEIATGILHNVGNVLNSAKVSAGSLHKHVEQLDITSLIDLANLFSDHREDLAHFLRHDPVGERVPAFLLELANQFTHDQHALHHEIGQIQKSLDHIRSIIAAQQKQAKASYGPEPVYVEDLIEDAIRMGVLCYQDHPIHITRILEPELIIETDRHQVLQILTNLFQNARRALIDQHVSNATIEVCACSVDTDYVSISVTDNGVGISDEHLDQVFLYGFTTKSDGNGYGLHTALLTANELGGALSVDSPGLGLGASFTLQLPVRSPTYAQASRFSRAAQRRLPEMSSEHQAPVGDASPHREPKVRKS